MPKYKNLGKKFTKKEFELLPVDWVVLFFKLSKKIFNLYYITNEHQSPWDYNEINLLFIHLHVILSTNFNYLSTIQYKIYKIIIWCINYQ